MASSPYINPLTVGSWSPARTDQGVDFIPNAPSPVVAIGDGVVTYSSPSTGWPGGAFIAYRLTSGPYAGQIVYVAEHLTGLVPAGTVLKAGQQIATALPGYPFTEWGWAAPTGDAPAVPYNGLPDGTPTAGGLAFARFMQSLGASVLQNPGAGSLLPPGAQSVNPSTGNALTQWPSFILSGVGAPQTQNNISNLLAWNACEGNAAGSGLVINNPFNTTLAKGPNGTDTGGTSVNGAGVKNYPTIDMGIQATIWTLLESPYSGIVQALKSDAPRSVFAAAIGNSPWGTNGSCVATATVDPNSIPSASGPSLAGGGGDPGAAIGLGPSLPSASSLFGALGSVLSALTSGAWWLRVGQGALGLLLLILGVIFIIAEKPLEAVV